jgi:RNA polymerase-interacting CarD/CdnL/TRCF family regulator
VVSKVRVKGQNPRPEDSGSPEGLITDTAVLSPGDRVVYPNQGVCRVTGIEVKEIAGQRLELVRMEREEDGAAVMVPRNKVASIGLRRVARPEYVEGVFHYLAAQDEDPELDWKVRHRDNADRLITGGVLGIAEVVKGLHGLSRLRPLPTKEREQYDNARHLLVAELSAALEVPPGVAEDFLDHALVPPAGTVFKLKPPPPRVELPVRIARRKPVAKSEDDLGLDDLGLDLGELAELGEGAAEGAAEGTSATGEGGGEKAEAGEGEAEGEAAEAPPAKVAKATPRREKAKAAPPAARKPAPKKAAKAAKPAAKKAAARKPEKKGARRGRK